jgi:hypothetical protein
MRGVFFALLAVSAAAQNQSSDQTGGITGMVRDSVSHQPVKRAMVSVNGITVAGPQRNQGPQSATTDATGTFSIDNLPPGTYQLMVQHQNYPQARFGAVRKKVEVRAGEKAGPVEVELLPPASVTGRFFDEDGDPLVGCSAQLHPAKNPDQGVQMQGATGSNEEGDYRLFGVASGKYILSAQCSGRIFQPHPFSSAPEPPPSLAYPTQYYPLVSDPNSAQAIELTPGSEKSGINFRMRPSAVTQIHGKLSPSGADWRGRSDLALQLLSLDQSGANRFRLSSRIDPAKGTFDFEQVFPGSYMLMAFSNWDAEKGVGAVQRIEVKDSPVETTIELRPAIDISGTVEIETTGANKLLPGQLQIQLTPAYQIGLGFRPTQVGDDGNFILKSVIPAQWRLFLNGPSAFMKSARMGSDDVTQVPIDLSSGAAGPLRIVMSTNTATIRGSAPAGQMVFLENIDAEMQFRGNRGIQADQSGQYKMEGLAPGKYRVVLADSGGPIPDEGGQEVTVHEGETLMIDLKPA